MSVNIKFTFLICFGSKGRCCSLTGWNFVLGAMSVTSLMAAGRRRSVLGPTTTSGFRKFLTIFKTIRRASMNTRSNAYAYIIQCINLSPEKMEVLSCGRGVHNVPVDVITVDLRLLGVAHLQPALHATG